MGAVDVIGGVGTTGPPAILLFESQIVAPELLSLTHTSVPFITRIHPITALVETNTAAPI